MKFKLQRELFPPNFVQIDSVVVENKQAPQANQQMIENDEFFHNEFFF